MDVAAMGRRGPRLSAMAVVGMTALLALSACATRDQTTYRYDEVGRSKSVSFGTIIASRPVDITGRNTGLGAGLGAAVGAGAADGIGQGSGNAWATGVGIVAGAVIGAVAEQAATDRTGIEYTLTLETGETMTIVQEIGEKDRPLAAGERVMVQTSKGYQRVLPADHLPTEVQRPQGITVVN